MSRPTVPNEFRSCVSDDGTQVSISGRGLVSVPEWLGSLTSLTMLDLGGNRLTALPDWIGNLPALTTLHLSRNRLTALPDWIGNLPALTTLHLSRNRLTALPDSIGGLTALTTLDLRDNRLTALPESIGGLTALTALDLRGNQLTALPESVGDLSALTVLDLFTNRLAALPESIGGLTALTALDLRGNELTALPESIGSLTALVTLYLSSNRLTALPGSLRHLTDLNEVYLHGNRLTSLPNMIEGFTALTTLDLGGNQLTALPESIGNLTTLTALHLRNNQLTALPDSIGNLTALTTLHVSRNQLTALPKSIGGLTALTTLDVGGNELTALPESIGSLTTLTALGLRGNELTALPESIGGLAALTTLDLDGNELTALPESIGGLTALTTLNLGGHRLTALPESIGSLTALTALHLRNNQLTALPDSIGNLTALTTLDLRDNHLSALPESIGGLTTLTKLDLRSNQLTALPESIGGLTALTTLDLCHNQLNSLPKRLADLLTKGLIVSLLGNPFWDPLPGLIERGADALAAYLESLEDVTVQYEAKLLLVGEGEVGKTSLVAALMGTPFVEKRPTTHGIEISSLKFRHPVRDLDMILRAWDFGGQEVYRVTHQFFFSRRALYIVVWNARQGQEQNDVEGWLRRIRLRVGTHARTIVVATHCVERLPELDYRRLEQTFPGMLIGSFDVDNSIGAGISALRRAIGREAAQLPQMGQRISNRWAAARDEILALGQAKPQISYKWFESICWRHGVTGREMVTLAQLMHDLGQIIYYGEDEGLRDIVVLNPEWLTKAISYVLEDKLTKDAGGVLGHARLGDIWQHRDEGPAYPPPHHPYFLRLMEKFDICYRLEGDELHSLVAQLVPHKRPSLPWQSKTQPPTGIRSLGLMCRLSESAPGLIPWLTVRHHRASTGMHWRHGIFLRHPIKAYASEALLELCQPNELTVEVRAPSPDLYFNVLRDSIEDLITRRWPGLRYELFIPCLSKMADGSMCKGQFPLKGLLRLREKGYTSYLCIDCAVENQLSLLLTGFTVPEQPVRDQLTRIENHISGLEYQAANLADSVRRVMRVVSTEVIDCPRLFTLKLRKSAGTERLRFHQDHYRLTLWCEDPGYWHPWTPASYQLDQPKEWFAKIGPYASLVFRTLQLVVPLAGSVANVLLPPDELRRAQANLNLMKQVVVELPASLNPETFELDEPTGELTAAEGEGLRAIRAILFEHDRLRLFGGLRRVQAPSGDFMWVCPDHYPQYDPGLPTIP